MKPTNYILLNSQLKVYKPLYLIIKEAILIGFTNRKISEHLGLTYSFVTTVREHLMKNNLIPKNFYGSRVFKYKSKIYIAETADSKVRKFDPSVSLIWGVSPKTPKLQPDYFLLPQINCFWALKQTAPDSLKALKNKCLKCSEDEFKKICDVRIFVNPPALTPLSDQQINEMMWFKKIFTSNIAKSALIQLRNKYHRPEAVSLGLTAEMFHNEFKLLCTNGEEEVEVTEVSEVAEINKVAEIVSDAVVSEVTVPEIVEQDSAKVETIELEPISEQEELPILAQEEPLSLVYNGLKIIFQIENKEVIIKSNCIEIK